VVHARHATVYLFYAKFPNTYLRDIARYGSSYKTSVANPIKIQIRQSRPYRMRHPQHQADFFRLLSRILYYMISGNSNIGYLAKDEWNPYYNGITPVSLLRGIDLMFRIGCMNVLRLRHIVRKMNIGMLRANWMKGIGILRSHGRVRGLQVLKLMLEVRR
jgi:hypothetical protein